MLRAFASERDNGGDIPDLVCYEKQSDWGGLWNYSWRTGLDDHGEPVPNSMYRYLWSNGPKECLEFADYSFEEHFGKPIASYPPRAVLWDYIKGRVEKSDVRKYIRFDNSVRHVTFDEGTEQFQIVAHDHASDTVTSDTFDNVVVASGHFSVPNMPHFPGYDTFSGRILHAHDFRDALEFAGKDIMLIGSSYSAEDIGSQCWKYGAKSIITSSRAGTMGFNWPDNWTEKPILTHVDGNTVHFADGTSAEVEAIISCTGYKHHFPYLEDDLRLITGNLLWTDGLYKGVTWQRNPKLFYLGMQDQYYTFNMFDAQAWFARDMILGRIETPDQASMEADSRPWHDRNAALADAYEEIDFQGDYTQHLVDLTDYPDFNIPAVNAMFKTWKGHKAKSIMEYRDWGFASTLTGTQAPVHHTKWAEALDDSMDGYLAIGDDAPVT